MEYIVEFTDEFEQWWNSLSIEEQAAIDKKVHLLERFGPALRRPHAGSIQGSKHPNRKELIIQHGGQPYRILYAFDPRRAAILLIGGNKTGRNDWYEKFIPVADRIYDEHLAMLARERKENDGEEL